MLNIVPKNVSMVNNRNIGYTEGVMPTRARAKAIPTPGRKAGADPAAVHARTRQAHAGEIAEDYVELIADLIDNEGEARVVDIAHRLGVSHVTVVRTVARLQRDGLVTTRPYRSIFLTDEGRAMAQRARRRHVVVLDLLCALGVPEAAALTDAEGIEHHVSSATLAAFERFLARESR